MYAQVGSLYKLLHLYLCDFIYITIFIYNFIFILFILFLFFSYYYVIDCGGWNLTIFVVTHRNHQEWPFHRVCI